jgi:small-conductance mechanosensitive channel
MEGAAVNQDVLARAREWLNEPWVTALLVLVLAVLSARLVDAMISRAVLRMARKTRTDLDERLIGALHRPIFVSVLLLGVYVAVQIVDMHPALFRAIVSLVKTVAILLSTFAGLRICHTLLEGLSKLSERVEWLDARTLPLFDNFGKLVLTAGAIYCLLVAWNLNVGPWLASAGVLALAIGFAAKDSIANLFGGLFVIMDSPYKIGDFINLDTGERGQVVKIGLRSTRLMTRDDVEITIPNATIAVSKIINESGGPWEKTRVTAFVGVAYGSDVDRVREVLLRAANSVEHVLDEPAPRVRFTEMGDSALIFRVLCWIDEPVYRGRCLDGLNTAIYKALNAENITIPFPQRDVHLYPAGPGAGTTTGSGDR